MLRNAVLFLPETRVPVYHHRYHRCRIYIRKAGDPPELLCPIHCSGSFLLTAAVYLCPIMMRRSAISPLTPVNFPLERSLYIGGIIRGILFGECLFFFAFRSHLTTRSRNGDVYILYSRILCPPPALQKPQEPEILRDPWRDPTRTYNHRGGCGYHVGPTHVD